MRVRLGLAYDGGAFSGWARQPELRTVQGAVEEALARITRTEVQLTVAGRTDTGVHATGQVAHVDLAPSVWEELSDTLVRRLNGVLDPDVRVHSAVETTADFDARFGALWRRYAYRVADRPEAVDPLRRYDTLAWPRRLDEALLGQASDHLLGEHDFAAFCRRREGASTIRALTALSWARGDDGVLTATVQADAFCHSMVRSLVGALLAVGEGRKPPDWPAGLLSRTQRADDVAVAPAHGLTLVRVEYPPDDRLSARTALTRRHRG